MSNVTPSEGQRLKFHYIKSPLFRVIHVDGAVGGTTPQGFIHMALYSERPAIAQVTEVEFLENGEMGEQEEITTKGGFVRELDIDAMLSYETAAALHDWLGTRIADLEAYQEAMRETDEIGQE